MTAITATRPLARRTAGFGTEAAFEVAARARRIEAAGTRVAHLEIGEPGIATPPHIVAAGVAALEAGETRYGPPAGLPELREAIAGALAARGVRAAGENVVVTPGAKPMLAYTALTVLDPGDEALLPDPGFPIYPTAIRLAGARPVFYPLDPAGGFAPDVAAIEQQLSPRTRLLVLNVPHNPTGAVADASDLEGLAALVRRHDLLVLSDEVGSPFRYDGPHESIAALPGMEERTVVVDSFSKTYAMTGWRLGYGVMPAPLVEAVTRLVINTVSCTPPFVQRAGLAALTGPGDAVRALVTDLAEKRRLLVAGLNAIPGVRCAAPGGTFFAFPDVREACRIRGETSAQLARRLLADHGVATVEGTAFGPGGEGFLRLSFAAPRADLEFALGALREALCP